MGKTGLVDRNGDDILEGEIIMVGMREGDPKGWTTEQVVRISPWWRFWNKEFALVNPQRPRDGVMEMQRNPKLRQKLSNI